MRRLADVLAASVALIVLSPLLVPLALAIMIDSPGRPFFRGPRVGRDGKIFRMWKFRTMVKDAPGRGPCITGKNDPRVTRLGGFLRNTKIDELPQFINVLTGDMTLVGPRPESPEIVALYTSAQRAVLDVKPGITGRVQLDFGEESEKIPEDVSVQDYYIEHLMPAKLKIDFDYLRVRTPLSDLRILAETAGYVFRVIARR